MRLTLLLLVVACPLQESLESLRRGDQALKAKDYDRAIREYTSYLEGTQRLLLSTLGALTNRAVAKIWKGDPDGAIDDCSRALKLAPKYLAGYLTRAWARREKGDLDGSLEDYGKVLDINPKSAPGFAGRADTRRLKDDLDGALKDCEEALALDPKSVDALITMSRIKGTRHEWKEAIAAATRAIDIEPKNAEARIYRGTLFAGMGDVRAAMDDLNQAVEVDPTNANGWLFRGALRRGESDQEGALSDLTRGLTLDPTSVLGLTERALLHLEMGQSDAAVVDARKAFKLAPPPSPLATVAKGHLTRMLLARAEDRKHRKDSDGAAEDFKAVIELDPGVAVAHRGLGIYYFNRDDFRNADASLTKAIELDSSDSFSHYFRATARVHLGEYASALTDVEHGIELAAKGDLPYGIFQLRSDCLLGLKRWREAEEGYAKALKSAPEDWDLRERVTATLAILPDLAKENPAGPVANALLGKGKDLISAGSTSRGIPVVQQALALNAALVEAHEVLALAYDSMRDKDPAMGRLAIFEVLEVESAGKGLSPAMRRIARKRSSFVLAGLLWMTDHQMPDGRWSGDGFADVCPATENRCEGKSEPGQDLRATSFVLLACLGAGYSHLSKENFDTKSMGDRIKGALQWMMALQDKEGRVGTSVEEHALATLVLSEAYGMTASVPLKEPAQKAVAFLLSLKRSEGAWPATAKAKAFDVQASGWALLALASARASELTFDASVIEESMAAIRSAGPPEWITLAASRLLKRKDEEDLAAFARGLALPRKDPPHERDALRVFLGTLAARLGDPARWEEWKGAVKEQVLPAYVAVDACREGSWEPRGKADAPRGRLITTALTLLALEIHYGYANTLCALADPPKK